MPICYGCGVESETDYCPDCGVSTPCVHCGQGVIRDDLVYDCCANCFAREFAHCRSCGLLCPLSATTHGLCHPCFHNRYVICESCGDLTPREELFRTPQPSRTYCEECYGRECAHCNNCGEHFWRHDLVSNGHGGLYCSECQTTDDEWESQPFDNFDPHFERMGSRRRYGVELETHGCSGYQSLCGDTIWECKRDCSIEGREFVSPVLLGDEGLTEIENFCAGARRRRWSVNRYCGYHAHFDASRESWESLRSVAYAYCRTYHLWCQLVSENRASNAYCGAPAYTADAIRDIKNATDWEYFVGARDRFEFVNWRAYLVHGSIEIRTHAASLDPVVICNWVRLHARFIDCVSCMDLDELDSLFRDKSVFDSYAFLTELIGEELGDYYAGRASYYGNAVRPARELVLEAPF